MVEYLTKMYNTPVLIPKTGGEKMDGRKAPHLSNFTPGKSITDSGMADQDWST